MRAAIYDYMVQSWSLANIGGINAQKKLSFNLRRRKSRPGSQPMRPPKRGSHVDRKAAQREMNGRLSGRDNSLDAIRGADIRGEGQRDQVDR
jgi:hypothetical protein